MTSFYLNKNGYDPFIDFVKGFCILSVVLTHSLPTVCQDYLLFMLWGGMAVPLFLLIQVFHAYKTGLDSQKKILSLKIVKRIVIPFLLTLCFIGVVRVLKGNPINEIVRGFLTGGGGAGSYYPWIYIEFAVLLALIRPFLKRLKIHQIFLCFLALSILLEYFCSTTAISPWLYRITCIRYVFLFALGIDWVHNGIELDNKRLFLSIISVCFIVLFQYFNPDLEPLFFHTAWKSFHWVCYFYVAYLLMFVLKFVYARMSSMGGVNEFMLKCGRFSYEIFLLQMVVFNFVKKDWFSFGQNKPLQFALWFLFVNFMSVVPVLVYKDIFAKRLKKNELR